MHYYINAFLGLVFLSTALHRIFHKKERLYEMQTVFHLPKSSDYFIIAFEFIAGALLLMQYTPALYCILTFLIVACLLMLVNNYQHLKKTFNDLFTFQPTATAFFLHFTYILIILYSISVYHSYNLRTPPPT